MADEKLLLTTAYREFQEVDYNWRERPELRECEKNLLEMVEHCAIENEKVFKEILQEISWLHLVEEFLISQEDWLGVEIRTQGEKQTHLKVCHRDNN